MSVSTESLILSVIYGSFTAFSVRDNLATTEEVEAEATEDTNVNVVDSETDIATADSNPTEAASSTETDHSYSYMAEVGGSYTLAARQAIQSYVSEKGLSVDESQLLAAEVNLVNAAGAPYLEVGEVVTISQADVAKEFSVSAQSAESVKADNTPVTTETDNLDDTQRQNDTSAQSDSIKGETQVSEISAFTKTVAAGDSYTVIAREAVKTKAAGSLNNAQKIAAETYLANQAGFPELIIGQNVTIGDSAIQDALKFARGLTAEQQAMWQAYTQKVVL